MRFEFAPKRGLQRAIQAVISRPAVMSRFIRALSQGDGIAAQRLLRATGDLAHVATVMVPMVTARVLFRLASR